MFELLRHTVYMSGTVSIILSQAGVFPSSTDREVKASGGTF